MGCYSFDAEYISLVIIEENPTVLNSYLFMKVLVGEEL